MANKKITGKGIIRRASMVTGGIDIQIRSSSCSDIKELSELTMPEDKNKEIITYTIEREKTFLTE